MVIIGMVVVIIEASTGEVKDSPNVKHPWLQTIPNSEAKNNSCKSREETFSLGANIEATQKQTAPPIIRILANRSPVIPASIAAFPIGDINPHILAAASKERCPLAILISIFFLPYFMLQRYKVFQKNR